VNTKREIDSVNIYIKQNTWVALALFGWLVMESSALASSDGESYTLVMSKDAKLCNAMLALYNEDMKAYKRIRYDQHEMFTNMWKPVDLHEANYPTYECSQLWRGVFDIDNDGKNELVVKASGCMSGILTDGLFIYPDNSDVLSKLKPGAGGLHALFDNPNHLFSSGNQIYLLKDLPKTPEVAWVGGHFVLHPFIREGASYISMTDQTPRWIVIAKYKQAEEMQEICYFFNPNIKHQRY
jgi:hypothetical protein